MDVVQEIHYTSEDDLTRTHKDMNTALENFKKAEDFGKTVAAKAQKLFTEYKASERDEDKAREDQAKAEQDKKEAKRLWSEAKASFSKAYTSLNHATENVRHYCTGQ